MINFLKQKWHWVLFGSVMAGAQMAFGLTFAQSMIQLVLILVGFTLCVSMDNCKKNPEWYE
jgi:hypothetical protein